MYKYYKNSEICYAYLSDVPSWDQDDPSRFEESFKMSRWYTRGWTLQELLAPRHIEFYANNWQLIGEKRYYSGPYINLPPHGHQFLSRCTRILSSPRLLHTLLS